MLRLWVLCLCVSVLSVGVLTLIPKEHEIEHEVEHEHGPWTMEHEAREPDKIYAETLVTHQPATYIPIMDTHATDPNLTDIPVTETTVIGTAITESDVPVVATSLSSALPLTSLPNEEEVRDEEEGRKDENPRIEEEEEKGRVRDEQMRKDREMEPSRGRRGAAGRRHAATVEATAYRVADLGRPLHGWKKPGTSGGAEQEGVLRTTLKELHSDKNTLMETEKAEEEEDEEEEDEDDSEEEEEEEEEEEVEEEEEGTESPTNQTVARTSFTESLPGTCQTSNGQISCRGVGMNHLPIITDLGITTLDLAENSISLISSRGFSGLPNLESIDLSKNRLDDDSLSHHLFSNLTRLRRLNLDDNQLTRIPLLPPSLEELKMNDNKITRLTPHSFKGLFHLLSLELEENLFHDGNMSPLTFKPLRRVQYLRLDSNRFRSLPLGLPRSLQELRMRDNQLQEVPEGVLSELAKLRVLDLSHNLLHEGDISNRAWVKLTSLEALDLSHNRLTSVPLYLPRPLRQLTLQHNSIGRIPAYVFGHLRPGLESLRLSHNALGDEGVQGVSFVGMYRSLVELLLDNNRLGAVPRSMWQFRNLQVLRLDYNQIRSVAVGSVCHSGVAVRSALASLHLENNLIGEEIPSTTLDCIQDPSSVVTQPQEHIHAV